MRLQGTASWAGRREGRLVSCFPLCPAQIAEATNFATKEWWTGKHLHDALAVGNCKCKEAPRFTLPEEDVREALAEEGERFGITAASL